MFHRDKQNYYFFYILLLLELIIVLFIGYRSHTNIAFQNDPFYSLNDNWFYYDDSGTHQTIQLPLKLDAGEDNTITIHRKLPFDNPNIKALCILTKLQSIQVSLDNHIIYSRMIDKEYKYLDVPTTDILNIIDLPNHVGGKLLTLKISSKYAEYAGVISEVFAGTKASFILYYLNNHGIGFIFSSITLVLGFVIIISYFILKKRLQTNRSLLFLGWFAVLCSTWIIMESNLTQMFIENEFVISTLTYLSLMTFPIPILIYIAFTEGFHHKKHLNFMIRFLLLNVFVLILFQFFNIMDFHESVAIVRVELAVLLTVSLFILLRELFYYKNKEVKMIVISSCILFFFGITEIIAFYYSSLNTSTLFQIGFIIFITMLSWDALRKVAEIIKLSQTAKHYKFLATKDLLTSCRNRVAYSKDMDRISLDRNITIFVADMDQMKQINDTYGHHAGDEAIVHCSRCLLKVFGRRVYRIGGDEFVMIQYDLNEAQIASLIEEFQRECVKENTLCPYHFTMSIGYAVYDSKLDQTIHDTFKRADQNMYQTKHKIKEHYHCIE